MEAMSKNTLRVSELIICISLFELGSTTLTVHLAPLSCLIIKMVLFLMLFLSHWHDMKCSILA